MSDTPTLTRRGFLFGAGAVAIMSGAMPLSQAIEAVFKEPQIEAVKHVGRIVRVAGSGALGDGLIVAAPGSRVAADILTSGYYGPTVYPGTPIREALATIRGESTIFVPDFMRRRLEIAELALEDPELAGVIEYAQAMVRGRGRRIITL
jgi:hypothetical protein